MKFKKITAAALAVAMFAGAPYALARLQNVGVVANATDMLTEGDWTYYVKDDGSVGISKYSGTVTNVTIPSTIDGCSVTSMMISTFEECTFVTSVSIPSTVTDIFDPGCGIFKDCVSLENITVDAGNENYSSVDGVLFNKDKTELIYYPQGKSDSSYSIPAGVEEIYEYTFYNASNLISVTIPDGVKVIGALAFNGCTSLASLSIPDSVTELWFYNKGGDSFVGCTSLESVTIGANNTNYMSEDGVVFNKDKTELLFYPAGKNDTSYVIPDGVISIRDPGFNGNTYLTSLAIPARTQNALLGVFDGCTSLEEIIVDDNNAAYQPSQPSQSGYESTSCYYWWTDNGALYYDYFFYSYSDGELFNSRHETGLQIYPAAKKDTSYTIPDGVEEINSSAFEGNTYLTEVTIPASVTRIDYYAFRGCTSITTVNYGGTMEQWNSIDIADGIYDYSDNLTNAIITCTDGVINGSSVTPTPPDTPIIGEIPTPVTPPIIDNDTYETDSTTSSTTSETEADTVTKVDEETGVKVEISKEDADIIDADFTVTHANHDTLLDLIKQIVDKIIDTITDQVRKAFYEAADTVKNGKGFAFDIGFKKNGAEVRPAQKVTVSIPVPDEFKSDSDKLNVYHLTDNGAEFVPS